MTTHAVVGSKGDVPAAVPKGPGAQEILAALQSAKLARELGDRSASLWGAVDLV